MYILHHSDTSTSVDIKNVNCLVRTTSQRYVCMYIIHRNFTLWSMNYMSCNWITTKLFYVGPWYYLDR